MGCTSFLFCLRNHSNIIARISRCLLMVSMKSVYEIGTSTQGCLRWKSGVRHSTFLSQVQGSLGNVLRQLCECNYLWFLGWSLHFLLHWQLQVSVIEKSLSSCSSGKAPHARNCFNGSTLSLLPGGKSTAISKQRLLYYFMYVKRYVHIFINVCSHFPPSTFYVSTKTMKYS